MYIDVFNSPALASPHVARRITLRLVAYWEYVRGTRHMPAEGDINPDDIEDLWDNCFLVHTKDLHQPGYRYTHMGHHVAAMCTAGLGNDTNESLERFHTSHLSRHFQKVIDTGKPVIEEGGMTNALGHTVLYRQCLLPLGNGTQVDAVLGAIRYKIV